MGNEGLCPGPPLKGLLQKALKNPKNFSCIFIVCFYSLFDGTLLPSAGPHPRLWFGERGGTKRAIACLRFLHSPAGRISLLRSKNFTCRRHISHAAGVFHCDVACNITRGAPSPLVVRGPGERKNGGERREQACVFASFTRPQGEDHSREARISRAVGPYHTPQAYFSVMLPATSPAGPHDECNKVPSNSKQEHT